jgi:hypothetical protein
MQTDAIEILRAVFLGELNIAKCRRFRTLVNQLSVMSSEVETSLDISYFRNNKRFLDSLRNDKEGAGGSVNRPYLLPSIKSANCEKKYDASCGPGAASG